MDGKGNPRCWVYERVSRTITIILLRFSKALVDKILRVS